MGLAEIKRSLSFQRRRKPATSKESSLDTDSCSSGSTSPATSGAAPYARPGQKVWCIVLGNVAFVRLAFVLRCTGERLHLLNRMLQSDR